MKAHQKFCALAACVAVLATGTGCGGLSMSPSVSPATFLLPGLLKVEPPPQVEPAPPGELPPPIPTAPAMEPTPAKQVALAR